ncbi:MAG: hypothetical protein WD314_06960 [Trueperaceae bacterium]
MRQALAPLVLFLLLLQVTGAVAERIEIDTAGDPDSRLEIRNLTLPGGAEVQLYVIQGNPVEVTIGERQLIAEHIEVDLTHRLVRIVGFGTFITPDQTVQGLDLVIELEQESLTGRDVLIVTEAIDVTGVEATRMPGQIDVVSGAFSPCSRCGQGVEDFGFRAERIELYPGDRLVAFAVVVLVRGVSVLELPVLVVPLARPDRQPRLSISQGSAGERAEVALDWPYVAGADAFGTFSVRYYADVDPVAGGGFQPLGGRVTQSYLGGGVAHVFYTERGQGEFDLFYRPGFLTAGGDRERPQFTVMLAYATEDEGPGAGADGPAVDLEIVRDDARRDRLLEYRLELADGGEGIEATFLSQGFVDADPDDAVDTPSYDDRATPRRTPVRLVLEPEEERFTIGPLVLRRLALDLGVFEDASNPTNRSAAGQAYIDGGRLLERHSLELTPMALWSGMEVRGHTNFVGHYYTTGERQIDWDMQASATQRFAGVGSFGIVFNRDVNEGETPFRFDQIPLRTRTDLRAELRLEPFPWLAFEARETYVFRDSRRPELEGFLPLESELRLFGNLAWLDASVSNSYDIAEGDPGNLDFEVTLRSPEPSPRASLEISHLEDLAVRPDRLTGEPTDESTTRLSLSYGLPALRIDAAGGYRYRPVEPDDPDDPLEHWLPFEAGLTIGTLEQEDPLPGLRVGYERNLNRRRVEALSLEARARIGELELAADQRFDLPAGGTARSSVAATYPGIARIEATNLTLLRPQWLGLPAGEPRATPYTVTLRDAPLTGREAWQLRYVTRYDPALDGGGEPGGFRDTGLEARVLLEDEHLGGSRFSVDLFADLQLHDDRQPISYLRRASIEFAADIEGLVGVQGALGYRGIFNNSTGQVSRAELRLDEVAITVRALDELYLGALFDDVWDLTGGTAAQPAFDLRPELFVVWDRCCWALMGGWNTETGQLRLSLTAPGSSQGLTQVIDSPLVLPGRGTP